MKPRRMKISTDPNEPHDLDRATPGEERRSDRPGRRAGRRSVLRHPLTILAGLAVTAYALAAVALNVLVDTEAVRSWIAPRPRPRARRSTSAARRR